MKTGDKVVVIQHQANHRQWVYSGEIIEKSRINRGYFTIKRDDGFIDVANESMIKEVNGVRVNDR